MNAHILIERFNALDVRLRCGIFAAAVLVLAAADYALIMRFQIGGLAKMAEEHRSLGTDIARVEGDMQRFQQTKKNLDANLARIGAYGDRIRPRTQSSAVLEDIGRLANENRVSIDQLSPSKDGLEALPSPKDVKYYALPIVINAHSGYHMFGRFLNSLDSEHLLVLVRDLHMEKTPAPADDLSIQATLKIVVWDVPESKK